MSSDGEATGPVPESPEKCMQGAQPLSLVGKDPSTAGLV